jgi:hypothetical protein
LLQREIISLTAGKLRALSTFRLLAGRIPRYQRDCDGSQNHVLQRELSHQAASNGTTVTGVPTEPLGGSSVELALRVNGMEHTLQVDPRGTLLDVLREQLRLTGTKKGCDRGECGACTVLIDGRRVNACLTFALMQRGREITTIEGLAQGDQLHPIQAAFIAHCRIQITRPSLRRTRHSKDSAVPWSTSWRTSAAR